MTRAVTLAILLLAATALHSEARQGSSTVYVAMNDRSPCVTSPGANCEISTLVRATLDPSGGRIDWTRAIPRVLSIDELHISPDGGFLVWMGSPVLSQPQHLYLHGLASGATFDLGAYPGARGFAVNPQQLEAYVIDAGGVVALTPAGATRYDHGCAPSLVQVSPGFSGDGDLMSYGCGWDTIVFDTRTGSLVRRVPFQGAIGLDGADFYAAEFDHIRRRRLTTDDVLAEVPAVADEVLVDPVTGDVIEFGRGSQNSGLHMLDRSSLARRWSIDTNVSFWPVPVLDTESGYMYFPRYGSYIGVANRQAGTMIGLHHLVAQDEFGLATAPPPPRAPTGLMATVTGNAVAMAWQPGGAPATTTRYVLEVGSAPGLTDIFSGLDVGLQNSFGASGVPPGTYYVRVRAGNYSGLGAPSNEVAVVVP